MHMLLASSVAMYGNKWDSVAASLNAHPLLKRQILPKQCKEEYQLLINTGYTASELVDKLREDFVSCAREAVLELEYKIRELEAGLVSFPDRRPGMQPNVFRPEHLQSNPYTTESAIARHTTPPLLQPTPSILPTMKSQQPALSMNTVVPPNTVYSHTATGLGIGHGSSPRSQSPPQHLQSPTSGNIPESKLNLKIKFKLGSSSPPSEQSQVVAPSHLTPTPAATPKGRRRKAPEDDTVKRPPKKARTSRGGDGGLSSGGATVSDMTAQMLQCWKSISAHRCAEVFQEPVTEDIAPGYDQIIKNKIDLQTIRQRIESKEISTPQQFSDALQLMFENARTYNGEDSDIASDAKKLETYADRQLSPLVSLATAVQERQQARVTSPATPATPPSTASPTLSASRNRRKRTNKST